ncbi:Ribosomal RNA small subunit methyltransferase A [Austwickia sp. TVS 96-490-7B]|uniref:16S rRNA (adenine(1518)-N(6)/adenine(1519)-N(6))- dimethyltransferase RsmA n=1 Tax=Austwickia sp. TVS 96-490-7B TaxID=2830843 RepID=UPI001C5913C2|nr:16S rRNA (adenine(1518)-N(6)/adenine(1519)-N(6))-dimethyltransferase RsmA [Austwickia sp. TVS 96-490-7B]MBW3085611.1 Ribosomal RNA small subunit methyltransferase A [Austwickia sp. TVS 96-490-7B]
MSYTEPGDRAAEDLTGQEAALVHSGHELLGAASIREIAGRLGIRPTKQWGQNFVVDANTVRRIVRLAGVGPQDSVVEIGPGLGSLTLALLEVAEQVTAVEIDPVLAAELPHTVARLQAAHAGRLQVVQADAMTVTELPGAAPTALVANLPYNVSVPVLLTFLERFSSLQRALVMVQWEVAERLAARPGSKAYGVPSVKAAWYGDVRLAGTVPRAIFWPIPHVDSGLVEFVRRPGPLAVQDRDGQPVSPPRSAVFSCVDAAFAQRRKTLRAALAGWAGGADRAEAALVAAGVDPRTRGEQLGVEDFVRVAAAHGEGRGGASA